MRDPLPTLQISLGPSQESKHFQLEHSYIIPTFCLSVHAGQCNIYYIVYIYILYVYTVYVLYIHTYILLYNLNTTGQAVGSVVNY